MAKVTPIQNLDFIDIKNSIKEYLKNQKRFIDYDFEGSNLSALIDLLAYNAYYNSYYYNMAISENFMDSAQQRNSVISHAKELNYLPRSRRSSRARMNLIVTMAPSYTGAQYTLPAETKFNGKCGNRTYTFLTDKAYSGARITGTNQFLLENVNAYEGRMIEETLSTEDTTVLSNAFIDTSSLKVTVSGDAFTYRTDIFGIGASDNVYYLQAEADELYSLQFGENVFGVQPDPTDEIVARYRITSGEQANGVTSLTIVDSATNALSAEVVGVNAILLENTSGGSYAEDIESIRKFAPKALQVQERAVTKRDYEVLLKQRFSNIEAISVYGGDEVDPPQYGKVFISVDVAGGDGASDFDVAAYRDYLSNKTPLTIEPVFVAAKFMYVDAQINVTYDPNLTDKSSAQIRSEIIDRVVEYQTTSLNKFNATLRQSNLSGYLDSTDVSILSTDIVSKPIIEYVPSINSFTNPTFSFATQLVKPYPYNPLTGFSNFTPTLRTTTFTLNGTLVRLIDDGNGEVIAVTAESSTPSVFKRGVGTIDYTIGKVRLSNFIVDDYTGDSIKFVVSTANKDITSPKDRILVIRRGDVNVTVTSNSV